MILDIRGRPCPEPAQQALSAIMEKSPGELQVVTDDEDCVKTLRVMAVAHGLTVDDIADMIPAFPTFGEAARLAALAFYKDVTKLSCCAG